MRKFLVRRLFLALLPVVAGCGLTDVLEPDTLNDDANAGTEIEVREFEDAVTAADLGENTVTLEDGTVVQIEDGTESLADDKGETHTLEAVKHAVEMGHDVMAWGEGEVESEDPLTLEATKVGFSITKELVEYEGQVVSVKLDERSFCLADGTTVVMPEPDPAGAAATGSEGPTLEDVAHSLEEGREVYAWGKGEVESRDPMVLHGLSAAFEISEPEPEPEPVLVDFESEVELVVLGYGNLILVNGPAVRVSDRTELVSADGGPMTLQEVHEALEAGLRVVAWGMGELESEDPFLVEGLEVVVLIEEEQEPEPTLPTFEGFLDFVDFFDRSLLLRTDNGSVTVLSDANTVITAADEFSPASIDDAEQANFAGHRVMVSGTGSVDANGVFTAATLVFETVTQQFDADIESVNGRIGFVLVGGTNVWLTGVTEITAADADSPTNLTEIQAALDAGFRVRATGVGRVMDFMQDTLEAARVTLQRLPAS